MPRQHFTRTFSVRAHLLALVVGTLLPALLVAAVLVRRVVDDNRDAVERRLLEAARAEAAIVDAELGGTIRALQGLAESNRLNDAELPLFHAQAQRLVQTQPTWAAVTLASPEGREIFSTSRPFGEQLPRVTDRVSFDRVVQQRTPAVGNLRIGQITGQLGFVVRVPVMREDQVAFVLTAWITSTGFANVLRREASFSDDSVRGVTDGNGVLAARSRDADRFVGQKGTATFLAQSAAADEGVSRSRSLDGTRVYSAFSRAPMSRWVAGVAVPAAQVDAPFRRSMSALAVIALVLLGAGGTGAYLISRRIAKGISLSTEEAEAIASGERPSNPSSRVDEIQRLLDALSRSAALLETRQRERDEQVARADAAREAAEAADRAKDQFLAMLGHELRNPLAPALTAVQLMKMRPGADTARERDVIERQIRHMARLVDDLLDVSRLRRGAIELRRERMDLVEAVERAVEMTAPLFAEKNHRLDVDVPHGLFIDADRIRIAQVLSNLLSNAAKYTEPGGHVTLRAADEDDSIAIECRDNGIGMASELVPKAFDVFVQGERGIDRRRGGLGLGLAVARTLVELHGGSIEAHSSGPGRGSTFVVKLPRASNAKAAAIVDDAVDESAIKHIGRVLVVDDNIDALNTLVTALRHAGVDVEGAQTPTEALDAAGRRPVHAAVLDIGLPEMSGFELARALRTVSNDSPVRLIAVTGYGREQDAVAARAAGFDAFFAKPVELRVLLEALANEQTL